MKCHDVLFALRELMKTSRLVIQIVYYLTLQQLHESLT